MHLIPVSSSNIDAVGYHEDERTLHVRFASGATYTYRDVDPEEHRALVAAPSVGSHFAKHIRPHYRPIRIQAAEVDCEQPCGSKGEKK